MIFSAHGTDFDDALAFADDIRARLRAAGRPEDDLRILPGTAIVVGATEDEAREKAAGCAGSRSPRAPRWRWPACCGTSTSATATPTGRCRRTEPAAPDNSGAFGAARVADAQATVAHLAEKAEANGWSLRETRDRARPRGRGHVGTPAGLADKFIHFVRHGAVDGFNISPYLVPDGLDDIVELLVPALQERGAYRTAYTGHDAARAPGPAPAPAAREARRPNARPAGIHHHPRDRHDPDRRPRPTAASPTTDAFADDWNHWHREHEPSVGAPHGFLAITSINWLTDHRNASMTRPARGTPMPAVCTSPSTTARRSSSTALRCSGRHDFGVIPERGGVTVGWGDAAIEVAKRGGHDIVRPRHPDAPDRHAPTGAPRLRPGPALGHRRPVRAVRRTAAVTVDAAVEGIEHVYQAPGPVEFEIDGRPLALVVFADKPEYGLFALFTDATSGVTTYARLPQPVRRRARRGRRRAPRLQPGTNLPCAYTDLATCPLPPADNRLTVAIEAGELLPYERQH